MRGDGAQRENVGTKDIQKCSTISLNCVFLIVLSRQSPLCVITFVCVDSVCTLKCFVCSFAEVDRRFEVCDSQL